MIEGDELYRKCAYGKAIPLYSQFVKLFPLSSAAEPKLYAKFKLCVCMMKSKNFSQMDTHCTQLLNLDPKHWRCKSLLAEFYLTVDLTHPFLIRKGVIDPREIGRTLF